MAKSLQDQLLKAGLVSDQRAKKAKSEKRKQAKQIQKNKVTVVNEDKLAAQKAHAEKTARDRQLNQQQQQQAEKKAIAAQIRHLIQSNSQAQDEQGDAYHFNEAGKVKSIYVSATQREHIVQGKLVIVKLDKRYHLVEAKIAEKISQRDASCVIQINDDQQRKISEDDPYAAFQIPDDLMW